MFPQAQKLDQTAKWTSGAVVLMTAEQQPSKYKQTNKNGGNRKGATMTARWTKCGSLRAFLEENMETDDGVRRGVGVNITQESNVVNKC